LPPVQGRYRRYPPDLAERPRQADSRVVPVRVPAPRSEKGIEAEPGRFGVAAGSSGCPDEGCNADRVRRPPLVELEPEALGETARAVPDVSVRLNNGLDSCRVRDALQTGELTDGENVCTIGENGPGREAISCDRSLGSGDRVERQSREAQIPGFGGRSRSERDVTMTCNHSTPRFRLWVVLSCAVLAFSAARAQEAIRPAGRLPLDGRVSLEWSTSPPLPREALERARRRQLELEAVGVLDSTRSAAHPVFIWPLRQKSGHADHGYWATLGLVDHDSRYPGFLADYNGGERTYDLPSGYNHQGTDLVAWPFGWVKLALGQVEVVAAAEGRIVSKVDGNFDRECAADFEEDREANYVILAHEDGSLSVYGHLRKGSLTPKTEGHKVDQGEILGILGSSGYSGYPHLHFEVYGPTENLIDPFAGPHNHMNSESWWGEQPPYYDQELLTILTHSAQPVGGQCKNEERPNVAYRFAPGDDVFLAAYARDLKRRQRVVYTVYEPDGEVFAKGRFERLASRALVAGVVERLTLPADAKEGRWTYRVRLKRTTLDGSFDVGRFEPSAGVRSVRPRRVTPGTRRKIKVIGFGFEPGLAVDLQARGSIEKNIEIRRVKIRKRRIVLTVSIGPDASPGPRDLVLTAPDYTQVVVEDALQVID
jgi:murein DD-endopeptidase MepM/ murein hydrolase activator NlpD